MAQIRVRYRSNPGEVHMLLHSPSGEVGQDMQRRGRLVVSRARQLAPVRTGQLRGSITSQPTSGAEVGVEIGATADHAMFVEFGRGPVTPSSRRFLSWEEGGGRVFARKVRGVAARSFLDRALDAGGD